MDAFIPFLKSIGRGDRLKRDLTRDEAAEAIGLILDGRAHAGFGIGIYAPGQSPDSACDGTRPSPDVALARGGATQTKGEQP